MSYSQLVLSDIPYGYWKFSDIPTPPDTSITEIEDSTIFQNNAIVTGELGLGLKPIAPNLVNSISLKDSSVVTINNIYNIFLLGSESKVATIELIFSITDSELNNTHRIFTIGSFLECYIKSDRIFLSSSDGQKISIPVENWEDSHYLSVTYEDKKIILQVDNRNSQEIDLGADFIFPDSSAPSIFLGPSASVNNQLYINSLALYTYRLSNTQINARLSWLQYFSNTKGMASSNNADYFHFNDLYSFPGQNIKITTEENFRYSSYDNVIFKNDSLYLKSISPPQIINDESILIDGGFSSTTSFADAIDGGDSDTTEFINNYNSHSPLDINGISFIDYQYLKINDFTSYPNSQNISVTMQIKITDLSTEQTILQFGDFLNFVYGRLYVTDQGKIRLSLYYDDGSELIILETSTIPSNSTYYNLGFSINNQTFSLIFNGISQTYSEYFPEFYGPPYINIGNNEGENIPFSGKIKNFSIRRYEDLSSIDFTQIGAYTLKLNNSLNVSQRGSWNYTFSPENPSVGSLVVFNNATKNVQLKINDVEVGESTIIPSYLNDNTSIVSIDAILETDDSLNEIPILNNLYISLYSDMTIFSKNSRYTIESLDPLVSETYVQTNPFTPRDSINNILSKSSNIGIKLNSSINTGCLLNKYYEDSEDNIRCLEFLVSISDIPSGLDVVTIVDFGQSISKSLEYNSSGIIINGDIDVYIDGVQVSTGYDFIKNDFYHVFINIKEDITEEIYLGCNYSGLNIFNGSIGELTIHNSLPINFNSYLNNKYNSYLGRITLSKLDTNSITISDSSPSNQIIKNNNGGYLEMTDLPKIKLIEDKWQSIVVN